MQVEFNPVVDNILASLTKDKVLHVSDIEHECTVVRQHNVEVEALTLTPIEQFSTVQVDTDVSSCAWDHNGGLVAVFGKAINIIDPRKKEVALVRVHLRFECNTDDVLIRKDLVTEDLAWASKYNGSKD